MFLALGLAVLIGISLALLGGGGSIITVPVLVYAAGVTPQAAVPMSLAIVGAVSFLGAAQKARGGLVHGQAVGTFGASGVFGAMLGAQFTRLVPPNVLLLLFALLMLAVALKMWRRPRRTTAHAAECKPVRCLAAGFVVGLLTGFLGVGGGFLLVPALVYFALLSLPVAVGTSLAIIALNSLGGLLGHWKTAGDHWQLTGLFLLAAMAGMLAGLPLTKRISAGALNRGFAIFVAAVGLFVIGQTVFAPGKNFQTNNQTEGSK